MAQASLTSSRSDKSFYAVNVRLLVGTLVVVALAAVLGYAWYKYQASRMAITVLERAEKLETEGKWGEAAAYYQRYLLTDPDNTNVLVQLIGVQNRGEPSPRNLYQLNSLLYRTLGRLPDREDLRLMLAENLLKTGAWDTGAWGEAEREALKVVEGPPEVAQKARKVIAVSKLRRLDVDHSIPPSDTLQELVTIAEELPTDHELALLTAASIRTRSTEVPASLGDPIALADRLVNQAVAAQPKSIDALMARYKYKRLYSLPGAKEDLAAALKIEPSNPEVQLAEVLSKVSAQSSEKELELANKQLREVITATPENAEACLALVEVLKLQDRTDEAIRLLKDLVNRATEKFPLQLALATLQLEAKQIGDAKATLEDLQNLSPQYFVRLESKQRDLLTNRMGLLTARIELAQDKLPAAIKSLRSIYLSEDAAAPDPTAEWVQACDLLAKIYQLQGAWDQAGTYWDALLRALPGNAPVAKAAVQAALRAGNGNRAIEITDRLESISPLTEEMLVLRVQALLLVEMQRAPQERNWAEFEHALEVALEKPTTGPELLFAQIERLKAESGNQDQALAFLREGEKRFDDRSDFWRGAVLQYAQLGTLEDQQRALERYRAVEPSQLEATLLEAAVLAHIDRFAEADKLLAESILSLSPNERTIIGFRRVELLAQHGQLQKASGLANDLLNAGSTDPKYLRLGAELALAIDDLESAEKWERKLSDTTANGPEAQTLKVKRLLASFASLSRDERQDLSDTISSVRKERPEWFEIISLAARYAELSGDQRQALDDYRLAVALGDRRQYTLRQLITLLYAESSFEEASHYLAIMASARTDENFVDSMTVEIARKGGLQEDTIATARQSVEQYPKDASRRVFLANLLLVSGEQREAEAVLRQASQDLPGDPAVWLGLVSYLAGNNRLGDAAVILSAIEGSTEIGEKDRHTLLARGYGLIGNYGAAAKSYQAALEQDPNNVELRLNFARSLRSRSIRDAVAQYQRILQLDASNSEAQNELAVLLASTGNPEDWAQASKLLEAAEPSANRGSSKALLRALLLSQQGRTRAERISKCRAARKLLEQHLQAVGGADAYVGRLMLAQIIEQEATLSGDAALLMAARDQLQLVIDQESSTVEHKSRFIEFLLRNADKVEEKAGFLDSADAQIQKLRESVNPADLGTAALCTALSAQLSTARGNQSDAQKVVEEFAAKQMPQEINSNAIPALLAIGKLYTVVGNHSAAEGTYRQILKLAPNGYVLVVQSLLEQDKRREAAQLCLDLAPDGLGPEMAQTLASIMTTAEEEGGLDFPEAESALQVALTQYPANNGLLQADAIRKASRGDYDAAIEAFRKLVDVDPQNSLALNNLATLLAERPALRDEALQIVQRAIQFAGRQPSLLDTKGTILLKLARADEAISDLEEATAGGVADARYYLHLAAAYHLAGRNDEAIQMLSEALGFGLEKFLLTGDDRQLLDELKSLKDKVDIPEGSPA